MCSFAAIQFLPRITPNLFWHLLLILFNHFLHFFFLQCYFTRLNKFNSRVEIPEIISAEQRCFIVLTFFSADSEHMKKISADQLCFSADQLWFSLNQRCSELKNLALFQSWTALFQREIALNQCCSALTFLAVKHWIFIAEQRCFSADLLWISSDINTRR